MKKIINGRRYDTETAIKIGEHEYSNSGDFNWYCDELYRKKTGEFFIYGEGGPMSKYAVSTSYNSWTGGEKITPISVEKARQWCEKYLDGDDYEKIFGEVTEDEEKQIVTFSLTQAAAKKLKLYASENGITMSQCIENFINSLS